MTTSRKTQLDPDIAEFVRALAREAARRDHNVAAQGREPDLEMKRPRARKNQPSVKVRLSDEKGGYTFVESDPEETQSFLDKLQRVAEDIRAGRDDELGIARMLKSRRS